jgi:hypothetical protein
MNLLTILYRPVSLKQFIWNIDRKLGLYEQLSAAFEIDSVGNESVTAQLIDESLNLMPDLRKRILFKGWRLRGEIESFIIVLILFIMVFISGLGAIPSFFPGGFGFLPGLGSDPNAEGIFPSGYPGVTPGDAEQLGIGQGDGDSQVDLSDSSSQELGEIGDVLSEMGEELEDNASTSEFGQSLQRGDYDQAADDLSDLAENLDELSDQTKQNLEESFRDAADQLQEPGQQEFADALREAVEAIRIDSADAEEKLDELASQIDALEERADMSSQEEQESSFGIGEPETGEVSSFERIMGGGETIDLTEFGPASTLLQPTEGVSGDGGQVIGGDDNYVGPIDDEVIQGMIDPYILPWNKRYVVTTYFSP